MSHDTALMAIGAGGGLVGSTYAQAGFQQEAANSQLSALTTESKESTLNTQQKTLANYDALQKLTAAQEAQGTVRGFTLGSPSFNAIQRQSVNISAKAQKNINIEGDITQENIAREKQNVKDTLNAQFLGDIVGAEKNGAMMANGIPTGGM